SATTFTRGVDAAVEWPSNGKAYFFKDNVYVRIDLGSKNVDPGYPLPIEGYWPGIEIETTGSDSGAVVPTPQSTIPPPSGAAANPVVQPEPILFPQFIAPWGASYMRAPGQRNDPITVTGKDSWSANGCFPSSIATVMNWWCNLNPESAGKLSRNGVSPSGSLDPVALCNWLFGQPFVPSVHGTEWSVDGQAYINAISSVVENNSGRNMTYERVNLATLNHPARIQTIKNYLQRGPLIALLQHPGHFVVIEGFRNDQLLICDPGNITVNAKHWKPQAR